MEEENVVEQSPVADELVSVNPILMYLQNVLVKEKSDEYVNSLNEEQKKFLIAFVSGFQSAVGNNVVGVYDYEYINKFQFTEDLLKSVNVVVRPIEVTDLEMKFVIVAQF